MIKVPIINLLKLQPDFHLLSISSEHLTHFPQWVTPNQVTSEVTTQLRQLQVHRAVNLTKRFQKLFSIIKAWNTPDLEIKAHYRTVSLDLFH
jgi:hypothetical protein